MLSYLFVIIGGLILSFIYYYRRKRNELLEKIKDVPDIARHYPIIGVGHLFIGKSPEEIFRMVLDQITKSSSSVCKCFIFTKLIIFIKNPKDIQKILLSPQCLEKGWQYSFFPFKNGLFTSKPALWRPHRKMLNKLFHKKLLHSTYMQQLNEVAQLLVTDIQCKVGANMFDIGPFINYRSTNLQLKFMVGEDIGTEKIEIITENTKKIMRILGDGAINIYKHFVFFIIGRLLKLNLFGESLMNNNLKNFEPAIENARKKYFENLKSCDDEKHIKTEPATLINRLVTLVEQGYLTGHDMNDHIATMLLAGAETLATSLSSCILCLAMNGYVQENCASEIKEVLGDQLDIITTDDLNKLGLLDRTIKECMRLIPTAPAIIRTCDKDFHLDDDKIIPAGTEIVIPIISVQNSKEYWGANPIKFNPDNFLPENVANRPLLSFMPFSYGVRDCIAKNYAQYALKVFIVHLLVNYRFSTDLKFDDLKFAFGLTILLENKHIVRIEKR